MSATDELRQVVYQAFYRLTEPGTRTLNELVDGVMSELDPLILAREEAARVEMREAAEEVCETARRFHMKRQEYPEGGAYASALLAGRLADKIRALPTSSGSPAPVTGEGE